MKTLLYVLIAFLAFKMFAKAQGVGSGIVNNNDAALAAGFWLPPGSESIDSTLLDTMRQNTGIVWAF